MPQLSLWPSTLTHCRQEYTAERSQSEQQTRCSSRRVTRCACRVTHCALHPVSPSKGTCWLQTSKTGKRQHFSVIPRISSSEGEGIKTHRCLLVTYVIFSLLLIKSKQIQCLDFDSCVTKFGNTSIGLTCGSSLFPIASNDLNYLRKTIQGR